MPSPLESLSGPGKPLTKEPEDARDFGGLKLTASPRVTPSMRSSREVLDLNHLYVICHAEGEPWALAEGITAVPAPCLASPQWQPLQAR